MKFRIGSIIVILLFFVAASSGTGYLSALQATVNPPPPPPPTIPPTPIPPTAIPYTAPMIAGVPIFPADNAWNQTVTKLDVHPNSDKYIASINDSDNNFLHADFGSNLDYGIPYIVVPGSHKKVPVEFTEYPEESDPGPYPIPDDAPIEAGDDHHLLILDRGNALLYELYGAEKTDEGWKASSGAIFDLRSNKLRPQGWTSADAAGLSIFAGLVRFDEVKAGKINHALRFTVEKTQKGYIFPATHYASDDDDPNLPPMGLRLRLKADFDISKYKGQACVILEALKRYGMIVADNGTSWFITGTPDERWDDEDLDQLKTVPGTAFEVVDTGEIITE
jgi:hypothetical protein